MRDIRKVVVVGAGISGLACAFRLQQLGIPVLILEASAKAGGVISSVRRNGLLFEGGPQCPRFPKAVWTLISELGLKDEFIAGDPRAKRYILRDGQSGLSHAQRLVRRKQPGTSNWVLFTRRAASQRATQQAYATVR